ncbi:MAG: GNAT family N-acetyltransferase [Lactobacillaceae bacterium]|nr:GNAT family N-acetyltransferase [Lactobacillaceae bacterium]
MDLQLRKATTSDIPVITAIIAGAKEKMHANGNPQWTGAYPSEADFTVDIKNEHLWVGELEGVVVGLAALVPGPDLNYAKIDGAWLPQSTGEYIAIHRIATDVNVQTRGIGTQFVQAAIEVALQAGYREVRIDTHANNYAMQRVVEKTGFTYNGIVKMVIDNTDRLAFTHFVEQ